MCSRGMDRTESRPQLWHILVPHARRICHIDIAARKVLDCPRDLPQFISNSDTSWNAWSMLARPVALVRRPNFFNSIGPGRRSRSLTGLESLPAELISLVLQNLALNRRDIIAVGLTSQNLWLHVLRHVERSFLLSKPPLAGEEIVCIGSYLTNLPDTFPTGDITFSSLAGWPNLTRRQARLINFRASRTYQDIDLDDVENLWAAAMKVHFSPVAGIPRRILEKMAMELSEICCDLQGHSPNEPWILRNLSAQEYMRCRPGDGPKSNRGLIDHPKVKLRVSDALLLRISWTSKFQTPDGWKKLETIGIHHGKWATHRFDIVLSEQADVDGWKDVTDEIVELAERVAEKLPNNPGASLVAGKGSALRTLQCVTRSMDKLEA